MPQVRGGHEPSQRTALLFIALLISDGLLGAASFRGRKFASETKTSSTRSSPDDAEHTDGGKDVEASEAAISKYSALSDPYKPLLKKNWKEGAAWLDLFSSVTGITSKQREEYYKQAVEEVLPESYIAETGQFALCVRTSSSQSEKDNRKIRVRCTPAINLLPSIQEETKMLSFKYVWKGLRDLVDEVKIPNVNFMDEIGGNIWRIVTNPITKKNERFKREQGAFDEKFAQYFDMQSKASAFSFVKESMTESTSRLMEFGRGLGHTSMEIISAGSEAEWPGENQPAMGSRYLLCFGRLSQRNRPDLDPRRMNRHCSGFWNKQDTKNAIIGLGTSLAWDDSKLFRDRTMYKIRNEILYGTSKGDATSHIFNVVGWDASSHNLATTIAKLVRERISSEGLKCPA